MGCIWQHQALAHQLPSHSRERKQVSRIRAAWKAGNLGPNFPSLTTTEVLKKTDPALTDLTKAFNVVRQQSLMQILAIFRQVPKCMNMLSSQRGAASNTDFSQPLPPCSCCLMCLCQAGRCKSCSSTLRSGPIQGCIELCAQDLWQDLQSCEVSTEVAPSCLRPCQVMARAGELQPADSVSQDLSKGGPAAPTQLLCSEYSELGH